MLKKRIPAFLLAVMLLLGAATAALAEGTEPQFTPFSSGMLKINVQDPGSTDPFMDNTEISGIGETIMGGPITVTLEIDEAWAKKYIKYGDSGVILMRMFLVLPEGTTEYASMDTSGSCFSFVLPLLVFSIFITFLAILHQLRRKGGNILHASPPFSQFTKQGY